MSNMVESYQILKCAPGFEPGQYLFDFSQASPKKQTQITVARKLIAIQQKPTQNETEMKSLAINLLDSLLEDETTDLKYFDLESFIIQTSQFNISRYIAINAWMHRQHKRNLLESKKSISINLNQLPPTRHRQDTMGEIPEMLVVDESEQEMSADMAVATANTCIVS